MINFEKILLLLCIFLFGYADVQGKATGYTGGSASITYKPKFSTAGFFELPKIRLANISPNGFCP